MGTAAVVPGLGLGLPLLGGFAVGPARAVLFFISVYTLSLVWTALFTFLAMLVSSRTITAAVAMLLSLALLVAGTYLEERLEAAPTVQGYTLNVNGELVGTGESPNPLYLPEGPMRDVIQFLSDFTPGGQTLQHINQRVEQPEKLIIYDAVFFVLVTGAGLVLFKRKDLKWGGGDMRNLLSANFLRLRKNKIFWVLLLVLFAFGAITTLWRVSDQMQWEWDTRFI